MPSTFAWLDYSAHQRRTMLEIVDLFREKGTVDELGVGTIRDAFANHLFPGTSTLHTRARYLLFVPWVYRQLERERVKGAQMAERARWLQARLVDALIKGGETEGVIGIEAKDRLLRLPSVVYWGGLGRFAIRLHPGSVDAYHRSIDAWYESGRTARRGDDEELLEGSKPNWHPELPPRPADLWDRAVLALRRDEAEYLRERIITNAPGSLLAFVLRRPRNLAKVERPWGAPHLTDAPDDLQRTVDEMRRFALLMVGAVLVYNVMLAEVAAEAGMRPPDLIDRYRSELQTWADGRLRPELTELRHWHEGGSLWDCIARIGPSSSYPARRFARAWISEALADPWGVADRPAVRTLIRERERALKRGLARLTNRRALERWSGESGLGELAFRWPNARTLINDITAGLGATDA